MNKQFPVLTTEIVAAKWRYINTGAALDLYRRWMKMIGFHDESRLFEATDAFATAIKIQEADLRRQVADARSKQEKSAQHAALYRSRDTTKQPLEHQFSRNGDLDISHNGTSRDDFESVSASKFLDSAQSEYEIAISQLETFMDDKTSFLVDYINKEVFEQSMRNQVRSPTSLELAMQTAESDADADADGTSRISSAEMRSLKNKGDSGAYNMTGVESNHETPAKNTVYPVILFWAGWIGFGFLLSFLSEHYHHTLFAGFGVLIIGGVLYALIWHTETTIKVFLFIIFFSLIGGVLDFCSDLSTFTPYDGPTRFHP